MAEVQIADVRTGVMFSLYNDFENFSVLKPNQMHETTLNTMLDQLVAWAGAMKNVRAAGAAAFTKVAVDKEVAAKAAS